MIVDCDTNFYIYSFNIQSVSNTTSRRFFTKLVNSFLLQVEFKMSEIDLSYITPMEFHLRKICTEVIKLDSDQEITYTQHFTNVCKLLTDRMKENDEIFNKLYKCVELAGGYADKIKISEPNEYDALIILSFPNPRVKLSRRGYVTINIEHKIQET